MMKRLEQSTPQDRLTPEVELRSRFAAVRRSQFYKPEHRFCIQNADFEWLLAELKHLRAVPRAQADAAVAAALESATKEVCRWCKEGRPLNRIYWRHVFRRQPNQGVPDNEQCQAIGVWLLVTQPHQDALERAQASVATFKEQVLAELRRRALPKPRPTIEELEKILTQPDEQIVEIGPDGQVSVGGGMIAFVKSLPANDAALTALLRRERLEELKGIPVSSHPFAYEFTGEGVGAGRSWHDQNQCSICKRIAHLEEQLP